MWYTKYVIKGDDQHQKGIDTMTDKITQKIGFTWGLETARSLGNEEMAQFFEGRLAQLAKKTTGERKLTPHQQENEKIKEDLLDNMENGVRYTIGDMLITFDCFPIGMTPNRLSALLSQLGAKGTNQIVRTEVKGKAYFEKA